MQALQPLAIAVAIAQLTPRNGFQRAIRSGHQGFSARRASAGRGVAFLDGEVGGDFGDVDAPAAQKPTSHFFSGCLALHDP